MPQNLRHKSRVKAGDTTFETNLPVFLFEEENIFYCYCPALDLYGYGKQENEAKTSFETNLAEFLKYANNKKTLTKELKRLGWIVKVAKKSPQFIAPEFADLVSRNEDLNRIMTDIPNVQKHSQHVRIPAFA